MASPPSRRRRPAFRPGVEALEDRSVPAAVTELPLATAPPAPQGITAGPDGDLWYTDPGSNKIGRLTPSGAVTEYTLPTALSDPRGIAAGPDGALWFAEFGTDRIGRLDPGTGAITEFTLTVGAAPADVAAGPDGALWFTESGTDQIGRITPAGVVTEFAVPGAGSTPFGITAGPDGNLWFTESGSDEVGRITPGGSVTEFAVPGAGSQPLGIASTSFGLFFTEFGSDEVGRITTAGAVTEFVVPGAGSGPTGITLGPDGALWFTESGSDEVGRITTAGVVTGEFPTTAAAAAAGIAAGPDGNLYFAQPGIGSVGRVTISGGVSDVNLRASGGPAEIAVSGGALYFTEPDADKIGRRSVTTGAVVEYYLPATTSEPRGIALGPDGALWFTEFGGDRIGRLDVITGAVTEFSAGITLGAAPRDIVTGSDGNLWFTESGTDRIGRITTAGVVTEFVVPGAGSTPFGIAAGPDGRLWFTEFGSDEIGAITAAGNVTEFSGIGVGSAPLDIAAGPDGNLWFTESGSAEVGRITTAGVVTEFATPTAGSGPTGIAAGPDGALWFTEATANQVGRVTVGGTITELAAGITAGAGLAGIVRAPDGGPGLWFAETTAGQLGRVALSIDLGVFVSHPPGPVVPGEGDLYLIFVTNAGDDPVDFVHVTDIFPAALTGVTWGARINGTATTVASGTGDIDAVIDLSNGTVVFQVNFVVDPAATGTLVNTASVAADFADPGNNTSTATNPLTPQVDVRVTKTDGLTAVRPGQTVTYTVVVSNTGPSTAAGVILADPLTGGFTGVTFTSAAAGGATGNTASGSGGLAETLTLPPGASVTYTVTATVSPGTGVLTNTAAATVPAGTTDTDPANNAATDQTAIEIVSPLVGTTTFAVGPDAGGGPVVKSYNPDGTERFTATAFDGSLTGGVRVAVADFNLDGVDDVVVGTGPGAPTRVRLLDGATRAELFAVDPFESTFLGGVFVAAGDVDGDGRIDLVITPDEGGGPRVRIFSGAGFGQIADFFGIDDTAFRGGARAATGDVNGDGVSDLLVAAGFGGGPRLAVFDGRSFTTGNTPAKLFGDFFVFEQTLRNGVFVAAGDLNGDGFADVIAGGGPGGGPRVFALSGKDLLAGTQTQVANFFAGDTASRGGVRVVAKNLDGDAKADLVVGAGTGAGSRVTAYLGKDVAADGTPPERFAFDAFPGFAGGVFVG